MNGIVTAIQSMCYDDGPGLRTTVFLKGCPLRCFWCHNPESLSPVPQLAWYGAKCIGCGNCVTLCPNDARPAGPGLPEASLCRRCGACTELCPAYALEQIGTRWEADALCKQLSEDLPYFRASGGGVTVSGGEPLLQWEFVTELLGFLRELGIHTAVETCGFGSCEAYQAVVNAADLILMDLKHPDEEAHKTATGQSNRPILENFSYLCSTEKPCILRTPVIPGVNDSPEVISRIAALAAQAPGLLYYELLRYHPLGAGKLESLGLPDSAAPILEPPTREHMDALCCAAECAGLRRTDSAAVWQMQLDK